MLSWSGPIDRQVRLSHSFRGLFFFGLNRVVFPPKLNRDDLLLINSNALNGERRMSAMEHGSKCYKLKCVFWAIVFAVAANNAIKSPNKGRLLRSLQFAIIWADEMGFTVFRIFPSKWLFNAIKAIWDMELDLKRNLVRAHYIESVSTTLDYIHGQHRVESVWMNGTFRCIYGFEFLIHFRRALTFAGSIRVVRAILREPLGWWWKGIHQWIQQLWALSVWVASITEHPLHWSNQIAFIELDVWAKPGICYFISHKSTNP